MENQNVDIQTLAREALDRISQLDADLQCNLGGSVLRELRDQVSKNQQDLIDRTFEVMAKVPNFARGRAAVVKKALQSLAS